jgi:hypothetical protein
MPDEGWELDFDHRYLLFELMDKLVELFGGIGEMMILANDKPFLKTSLFLIVRGALLDVIQAHWLFSKMEADKPEEAQKDLQLEVKAINRDHLVSHLFFLKKMNDLNTHLGDHEKFPVEKELDILNTFKDYSEILGQKIVNISEFKKTKGLVTRKITEMLDKSNVCNQDLRLAYINYSFYSKVEHSGILTAEIRNFNYKENPELTAFLNSSIQIIQRTIIILATSYFQETSFLEEFKSFKIYRTES